MNTFKKSAVIILGLKFICTAAIAQYDPSNPDFYNYGEGSYLDLKSKAEYDSRPVQNKIQVGSGKKFTAGMEALYRKIIKQNPQNMQWQLRNLSKNKILHSSNQPEKMFYGASITKIMVAGAFLNSADTISQEERQVLSSVITRSQNDGWSTLQKKLGDGQEDVGKARVQTFLNSLGITKSLGFRNWLDGVHGNEVTVKDMGAFIQATFDGKYRNSQDIIKLMHLAGTGQNRAKNFIPADVPVGGKTGTYTGKKGTWVEGRKYPKYPARHHQVIFQWGGEFYALTILSVQFPRQNDPGLLEFQALAGGLYNDILKFEMADHDKNFSCERQL